MEEKPILTKVMGNYPLVRILDFLIYSRDFDYPITEIAKNANVNFVTLKKLWPKLKKDKIVIITRNLAGSKLYKINISNPVVENLIKFANTLCWKDVKIKKVI